MRAVRAWKYRLYPSKEQRNTLDGWLYICKNLWNFLLNHTKEYYEETRKFPNKKQLHLLTKKSGVYSQVAQNVADRLSNCLVAMIAKKKTGKKAGFPRFKSIDRMRSFTYTQFGFRLDNNELELSGIGTVNIKKHRGMEGNVKTLTIKKTPSGKWYAVFTTEIEKDVQEKKQKQGIGIDLGIEQFAYLSNGAKIENPRHLRKAQEKLKKTQQNLSHKTKGSRNRKKAKIKVAIAHEKLSNRRRDFLHKITRKLTNSYSLIAVENLNFAGLAKGFLAKHVLDCGWAEFSSMLHYKAEEAGSEVILVDPAHTSQECSSCGHVQKKLLSERWHSCSCGASMHRDHNAAINILSRATAGLVGSNACGEEAPTHCFYDEQASSEKQEEAHTFMCG